MPKIFSDNSLEDLIYSGIENFNLLNSFDLKTSFSSECKPLPVINKISL